MSAIQAARAPRPPARPSSNKLPGAPPPQIGRILDAARVELRQVVLARYRPDCCIASTRIVCDALAFAGYQARAMKVWTEVFNSQFHRKAAALGRLPEESEAAAWAAEGARVKAIGYHVPGPGGMIRANRWPGHLVAIVEERWLLDLSLDQANDPEHGIMLQPLVMPVTREFLRGEQRLVEGWCESVVTYLADAQGGGWDAAPDWRRRENRDIAFELRARLEAHRVRLGYAAPKPGPVRLLP